MRSSHHSTQYVIFPHTDITTDGTAPNATASIVCIRASSKVLRSPFLLRRALPARVQNFTCFIPTETNWVSESGRNSATKIRWLCPPLLAILAPSCHLQMVTVCSGSSPTDSSSFPVALKLTEHTPFEWEHLSIDNVCLFTASQMWTDGAVADMSAESLGQLPLC